MRQIYYIDMDGVLAKWNESASEEETHEKGYFSNRDLELSALAMVRMLADAGETVRILSSVYQDDHSAEEKKEWLERAGLSDIIRIFVPYGEDKYKYISEVDDIDDVLPVLIDDYSKNLNAWEEQGYLPIKFMNGVNNRPKLTVVGNSIQVKADSWSGYSIDCRMSARQMFTAVTAIAKAVAA